MRVARLDPSPPPRGEPRPGAARLPRPVAVAQRPSARRAGLLGAPLDLRKANRPRPVGAFAQGATSFYVVQDLKTKKCTVVDKKPVATEATIVGPDGAVYKTKTDAETAMKAAKACT